MWRNARRARESTLLVLSGRREASVQVVEARGEAEFGGLDQLGAGHPHAVQLALEVLFPEIEELAEVGETGRQIQVLPDEALQHVLVVGHPVEDFGGGDAIMVELRN